MSQFLTPPQQQKTPVVSGEHDDGLPQSPFEADPDPDVSQRSDKSDRSLRQKLVGPLKRLKKKASFTGSLLHRSASARGDHLQKLYSRRRARGEMIRETLSKDKTSRRISSIITSPVTGSESQFSEQDNYPVEVKLQEEEEDEEIMKSLSAHIEELYKILGDYPDLLSSAIRDEPLEVRMENVTYTVMVDPNVKVDTVFNSSFLYPIYKFYKAKFLGEETVELDMEQKKVLDGFNLVFRPGKMYLVLGAPGSGKTTLLRAIAARLRPKKDETFEGKVLYNGRELKDADEFFMENAFGYIAQLDKHAPRLTVEETFEFAYQCKSGGNFIRDRELLQSVKAKEALRHANETKLASRLVLASLGLTEVKDTFVGDTTVRGVSGGQRRRVTVGEMLHRNSVLCCDEISTGLDAASTFDMIQMILHFGRMRKLTRIISLLQPSPSTVSLFDEVVLLAEGQILYAGPIVEVEDYFAKLGYEAPEFMDCADFMQMLSSGEGPSLYNPTEEIKEIRPNAPTISELAEIFRQSHYSEQISVMLSSPPKFVWKSEDSLHGSNPEVSGLGLSKALKNRYANNFVRSTALISLRFLKLWIRDRRVIAAGAVKNILMGVSVGGVFFDTTDPISIEGALFQAGLFVMLGAMQSSGGMIEDRIILNKHLDANFYSVWPFIAGRTLAQLPQALLDTLMFGVILYYTVGLGGREEASNLLTYLALLFVFSIMMSQQLSVFASFANASTMQAFSACIILMMMLFGGFIIAPDAIPFYFRWVYWWNPFAWVYRSLLVLEFGSPRWQDEGTSNVLRELGFVTPGGDTFGQEWIAYGFVYMVPYFFLCCFLTAVGLTSSREDTTNCAPEPQISKHHEVDTQDDAVAIPFKPVTLSFHDICYEVTASTKNEKLKLLRDVNGVFKEGRMCALMGSSGAGKTTLMDVIALRKRTGSISGDVLLNGWPQDPISFRRCSGYVEQFDVQTPQLTVKETIFFSARLRLDHDAVPGGEQGIRSFVSSIMEEVELDHVAAALVGTDETGGLSFEQKKRLSIAVELAASPSIIFLDEPTSGLDGRSALLVVKALRRIADNGRTICATIHQPSSTVFGMFDDLLLLKRGGQVVYHGELGENCASLISYFESRGAPAIECGENPADWMLRVMSLETMGDLADTFRKSDVFKTLKADLEDLKTCRDADNEIVFDSKFAVSSAVRQDAVNKRLRTIYWRSPTYNLARLSVSAIIAFILGSVFLFDWDPDSFSEIQMRARLSVIFLTFIITGIMAIISVLPVMTWIRDMYYRHDDAGMYGSFAMGAALGVAEKWFLVASSALFTAVFISTSHIIAGAFSAGFWGFFTFNLAIYSYIGQAFVCLVKPKQTAFILATVYIGLNNFFSGLIVRPQFLTGFFAVPYAITPGRYVYEGLVVSLYRSVDAVVHADAGSEFYQYLIDIGKCSDGADRCQGHTDDYIDFFFGGEFKEDHIFRNGLILGGILVLVRVLTLVALKYIRFSQ